MDLDELENVDEEGEGSMLVCEDNEHVLRELAKAIPVIFRTTNVGRVVARHCGEFCEIVL